MNPEIKCTAQLHYATPRHSLAAHTGRYHAGWLVAKKMNVQCSDCAGEGGERGLRGDDGGRAGAEQGVNIVVRGLEGFSTTSVFLLWGAITALRPSTKRVENCWSPQQEQDGGRRKVEAAARWMSEGGVSLHWLADMQTHSRHGGALGR